MISDEKIVCIKFVDLDQIYNFVVDKIFIWGCFGNDIGVSNLKFEISKLWNDLGWKIVYIKVIDPDQIYNFVVERIFIWDHYSCEMGYIRYLKVRIKQKYLIVGHTCLAKLLK